MENLCNWSDVWLEGNRSEQQVERLNLFIKKEIILQPQPHIDLIIKREFDFKKITSSNVPCRLKLANWLILQLSGWKKHC